MKHHIELRPFTTPNFVIAVGAARPKQEGMQELPKFAIHELSDDTLEAMCKEFRDAIFMKKNQHLQVQNVILQRAKA